MVAQGDGAGIVGSDTFKNDDASIASQITRIKALPKEPDAIMLCSYAPGGASAVRQIRAAGIQSLTGEDALAFFDAIAPIVHYDSIDMSKVWIQSRWNKRTEASNEGGDYINCPMTQEQYLAFHRGLMEGEKTEFKQWEKDTPYFDGCMPIEVMAERGWETLRYGPMKGVGLDNPFDNSVMQALAALPRPQGWAVTLEKNLPVAAGLGGGSADAGALFRLVEREQGLPDDWHARAARLGADVPACVLSRACIGLGTGTELAPVENDLAGMAVLLVNPRMPLSTGPVFKAWDGVDRGPLPGGDLRTITLEGRNDLEAPALSLVPQIGAVLAALQGQTGCLLARMSGSGATCFALYKDDLDLQIASDMVREKWGDWWQLAGHLR